MLRKSLETSIHEGFKTKFHDDELLKDKNGDYFRLKKKIDIVKGKGLVSGFIIDTLKATTKLFSDIAAHNFNVTIRKDDFQNANTVLRIFMEDFYTRIANE